jgi:hypothetical protein
VEQFIGYFGNNVEQFIGYFGNNVEQFNKVIAAISYLSNQLNRLKRGWFWCDYGMLCNKACW